jgi:hypothetical protein
MFYLAGGINAENRHIEDQILELINKKEEA